VAKNRLGKGLEALIPIEDNLPEKILQATIQADSLGGEKFLPLDKITANPNQPRKYFDEASLNELANSIREHGVIQPIIVEADGNGSYIIVAGERRSRAAKIAGLTEIPALIRNYSDEKRMEVALIENVQRADLNPVEEAQAYKNLMDFTGLSQDEVATKVGKNRSTVANALRLLKLPIKMQDFLKEGTISSGHARAILSVTNADNQKILFDEILAKGISVREAEKLAANLNKSDGESSSKEKDFIPQKQDPDLVLMEQKFIEVLGTKVSIQGDLKKGIIKIDYYSMEDLDRLHSIFVGKE
jgi:ParB family chromosome partitioning protein